MLKSGEGLWCLIIGTTILNYPLLETGISSLIEKGWVIYNDTILIDIYLVLLFNFIENINAAF
ncbi:MAG: hypothetical protein ACI909_003512 [Planctomycetota bacterium]|jgi:hypothetical protein